MRTLRMATMLVAAALAAVTIAPDASAFGLAEQMAATGVHAATAANASRSAAPTIKGVKKSLGGSASKLAKRGPGGRREKGRGPAVAPSSGGSQSGWGGKTAGWAKAGEGGGWVGKSGGGGWAASDGWPTGGNAWADSGSGSGWVRPGNRS